MPKKKHNPDVTIRFEITLTPMRAVRLLAALKHLAWVASRASERDFWKRQAKALEVQCEGVVNVKRYFAVRPTQDDEVAVEQVIRGGAWSDLPRLSYMDCRRVVARIGHRYSARELAERLDVTRRTVSRWRAQHKRGEWKKYGIE